MRQVKSAILILIVACSAGVSSPQAAHQVNVTATVAGQGPLGDTIDIRITNSGTAVAYLRQCGVSPIILVQQFSDNGWTGGVQNFMCVANLMSNAVVLGAGESLSVMRVFDTAGRYRFLVPVATTQDFSDAQLAVSNAFDVLKR